jgi:hypothetical protein
MDTEPGTSLLSSHVPQPWRPWLAPVLALTLGATCPAGAWETHLPWDAYDDGSIFTRDLLVGPAGHVVVAATLRRTELSSLAVASVARPSGAIRWTYSHDAGESWLHDTAIDTRGDVVVGGAVAEPDLKVAVIKLDGRRGTVRWRPDLGVGAAFAVATDESGDVIAYVSRREPRRRQLVKLSGDDGHIVWETSGDLGPGWYRSIAVDGASNIVLHDSHEVSKYDGRTGTELWSQAVSEGGAGGIAVVAMPGGDVVTQDCHWRADANRYEAHIARRHGADGAVRWRSVYPEGSHGCYTQTRVGPRSGVFIAGRPGLDSEVRLMAARLDATTGAERWRWNGPHVPNPLLPIDLAVGRHGDAVILASSELTALSVRTGRRKSRTTIGGLWAGGRVAVGKEKRIVIAGHGDDEDLGSGMLVVTVGRPGSSRRVPRAARRGPRAAADTAE